MVDDGFTDGYLLGMAKRKWKESKRVTSYTDEMDRLEGALVRDDMVLLGLCRELKQKEAAIVARIDQLLTSHRQLQEKEE